MRIESRRWGCGDAAKVAGMKLVVGLGNPGRKYEETRHNVGFRVLDLLAKQLGCEWTRQNEALVSVSQLDGQTLVLLKPLKQVNNTGRVMMRLSETLGFSVKSCILVQDDIDRPMGKIRTRMRGSDGGHRGVQSMLIQFQTDEFRRVKVGVRPDTPPPSVTEYLLKPFAASQSLAMDKAVHQAAEQLLELIRAQQPSV